jgi:translation initiation factor 2B subunit (eIF-2B alpha/beta/delta family)
VVDVFQRALAGDGQLAVAVAAIKALTSVIENSKAATLMGLEIELSRAAGMLRRCNPTSISLSAGCELFMRCAAAAAASARVGAVLPVLSERAASVQLRHSHRLPGSRGPGAVQGVADRQGQHLRGDVLESARQDCRAGRVLHP